MFTKKQTVHIIDFDESKLKEFLKQFNVTEYKVHHYLCHRNGIPVETEIVINIPFNLDYFDELDTAIGKLQDDNENISESFLFIMKEDNEIVIDLKLNGILDSDWRI